MRGVVIISVLALLSGIAYGDRDTLRCGSKIIARGMSMDAVRKQCGPPDTREVEERPVRSGNRVLGTYTAEIWIYKRGSQQFNAVLEFEDEELKRIDYTGG